MEIDPHRGPAEDQGTELVACCSCYPKDIKLPHLMVTAAKAAVELHVPTSPSSW